MKNSISLILLFILIPCLSFAHGSHDSGIIGGFTHPIFGLDHNFAIIGIGVLGSLADKRRWYLYPLIFWVSMVVGGYLGVDQEATLLVEKVIEASVITTGIFISFNFTKSKYLLFVLLASFGFFHGFAHGAEMPESTIILKYISGYSLGTILLSGVGYLIYIMISKLQISDTLIITVGGFLIGAGTIFLIG